MSTITVSVIPLDKMLFPLFFKLKEVAEEKGWEAGDPFTKEEIKDAIERMRTDPPRECTIDPGFDLTVCLQQGWLVPLESGHYRLSNGLVAMCTLWLQDMIVGH